MGRAGGGSSRAVLRGLVPGVAGTGGALCRGCLHLGCSLLSEHSGFLENFAAGQAVFSELGFAGTGCAQNRAYQLPGWCAMRGGAAAAPATPPASSPGGRTRGDALRECPGSAPRVEREEETKLGWHVWEFRKLQPFASGKKPNNQTRAARGAGARCQP